MPITRFPDPRLLDDSDPQSVPGLVGIGGDFHAETLLQAYRQGIFPWPHDEYVFLWFCPNPRGILRFSNLHLPKSLHKTLRKQQFTYSFDRNFEEVLNACANAPRKGQPGTWITPEIRAAYLELHRIGIAHSVEVWKDSRLVGGLYGVAVDGIFSGESMFHLETGASKGAILHLVEHLQSQGAEWMDIQMLTPHLQLMGAEEIDRNTYLDLLTSTQKQKLRLFE